MVRTQNNFLRITAELGRVDASLQAPRRLYGPGETIPLARCVMRYFCQVKHHRLALLVWALSGFGCQRSDRNDAPQPVMSDSRERIVLEGTFRAVTRAAKGRARIVRAGSEYSLHLDGVELAAEGAHVYLVGLDAARTSSDVDRAELKYDMGPLEPPNQVIPLPGAPDPAIRVVVLWNPRFAANLAAAPLRAP
jgi:hypothetical protein